MSVRDTGYESRIRHSERWERALYLYIASFYGEGLTARQDRRCLFWEVQNCLGRRLRGRSNVVGNNLAWQD